LSLLMAGSFSLALVAAFILSWPLRSTTGPRAT
jgi:predicted Co/Zn/Cd cation transporter (cation efflux family)